MADEKYLDYDEILQRVRGFESYHKRLFILLCIPPIFAGMAVLCYTFTAGIPLHRCHVPGCDNSTTTYDEPWVNFTIPLEEKDGVWQKSQCYMYGHNKSLSKGAEDTCSIDEYDMNQTLSCDSWMFDYSEFEKTIVMQYGLICEHQWLHAVVGSSYMLGMLVGAFIFGIISDRFGRKPCLMLNFLFMATGSVASAFAPDFITYAFLRFITGTGGVAVFATPFLIAIEMVPNEYRTLCGVFIHIPFTVGEIVVGAVAWFIRDCYILQLVISCPMFLLFSYWWLTPESVRWLIANKRVDDALLIIRKMCKPDNQTELSEFVQQNTTDKVEIQASEMTPSENPATETPVKYGVSDLLRNPVLRYRSLIMFVNWFVTSMAYYGLSMNASNLAGSVHLNFLVSAVVEFPAYLLTIFIMDKTGRKPILAFFQILAGVSCITAGVIPKDYRWFRLILSLVGKFGSTATFGIVFNYTAELYPTLIRNIALGTCSSWARMGGVLAPIVAGLGIYVKALPFLILGGVSVIAGLLALMLPETRGHKMPEIMEEAAQL